MQVLKAAGKNLTRAGLMKAARSMRYKGLAANPFALPGVVIHTFTGFQYPITQVKLARFNNGVFSPVGALINGRGA